MLTEPKQQQIIDDIAAVAAEITAGAGQKPEPFVFHVSMARYRELAEVHSRLMALLDAHDDALCARKHADVAAGVCVDGLRKLLGVEGFERRKVTVGGRHG